MKTAVAARIHTCNRAVIPCIVECDWIVHESIREGCRLSEPIHLYNEKTTETAVKKAMLPTKSRPASYGGGRPVSF